MKHPILAGALGGWLASHAAGAKGQRTQFVAGGALVGLVAKQFQGIDQEPPDLRQSPAPQIAATHSGMRGTGNDAPSKVYVLFVTRNQYEVEQVAGIFLSKEAAELAGSVAMGDSDFLREGTYLVEGWNIGLLWDEQDL